MNQPSLEATVENLIHELKAMAGRCDRLEGGRRDIARALGADPKDDLVAKASMLRSEDGIIAAINRLTATQAEAVALFRQLHGDTK
jgi:hypothetical protein